MITQVWDAEEHRRRRIERKQNTVEVNQKEKAQCSLTLKCHKIKRDS